MNSKDKAFIEWLKRARELVRKGWTQGADQRGSCFCAAGAMNETRPPDDEMRWTVRWPNGGLCILYMWNDAPGRTQAEVIAMFDNSIRAMGGKP